MFSYAHFKCLTKETKLYCDEVYKINNLFFDRFGRRFAILLSLFLAMLFGVTTAFSPNIYVYMVLKFFSGTSNGVIIMNTSVMGKSLKTVAMSCVFTPEKPCF